MVVFVVDGISLIFDILVFSLIFAFSRVFDIFVFLFGDLLNEKIFSSFYFYDVTTFVFGKEYIF